jgi:hypothetical protein
VDIMHKDEALKLALEAIEELRYSSSTFKSDKLSAEAITAIKEALAQPPLPVQPEQLEVWADKQSLDQIANFDATIYAKGGFDNATPLYTTPPQRPWVGLTDEERVSFEAANPKTQEEWDELFNGIEAKLKEKNA